MTRTDTSRTARAIQDEILRGLTGAQRLMMALEMSDAARELSLVCLRHEQPERTEAELIRELARLLYPPDQLPPAWR